MKHIQTGQETRTKGAISGEERTLELETRMKHVQTGQETRTKEAITLNDLH